MTLATPPLTHQRIRDAVEVIQRRCSIVPQVGMILGSGLGEIASQLQESTTIPYKDIPHFHGTSIEGHAGQMILGYFQDVPTIILQGRFHLYEGYSMEDVVFPTRTLCWMGIQTLILTNAAGGVNPGFKAGDLMLIEDHLNLMGDNPLKGPNLAQLGPRFPDMTEAYSKVALETFQTTALELDMPVHRGVYAGLLGPTYETPAEVRMLRTLGADAVGMSTVPENISANHLGVRVAGMSCITNLAAGLSPHKLTHKEVIENSRLGATKMTQLLKLAVPRLIYRPQNKNVTAAVSAESVVTPSESPQATPLENGTQL